MRPRTARAVAASATLEVQAKWTFFMLEPTIMPCRLAASAMEVPGADLPVARPIRRVLHGVGLPISVESNPLSVQLRTISALTAPLGRRPAAAPTLST